MEDEGNFYGVCHVCAVWIGTREGGGVSGDTQHSSYSITDLTLHAKKGGYVSGSTCSPACLPDCLHCSIVFLMWRVSGELVLTGAGVLK